MYSLSLNYNNKLTIVCFVEKAITFIMCLRETRPGHLVVKTERNKICHASNIIGSMEENWTG